MCTSFQLGDVDAGGATVFPLLGIGAQPIKVGVADDNYRVYILVVWVLTAVVKLFMIMMQGTDYCALNMKGRYCKCN